MGSPCFHSCPSCRAGHVVRALHQLFLGRDHVLSTEGRIMLVLSRKAVESIIIGYSLTVTVIGIDGHKARIGITAPPEIRVNREEVHRRLAEFATEADVVCAAS